MKTQSEAGKIACQSIAGGLNGTARKAVDFMLRPA